MKTPLDVYTNLQLILVHIDDIKVARGITAAGGVTQRFFEKKPAEVFDQVLQAIELLNQISLQCGCGPIEVPDHLNHVLPRDVFQSTKKILQHLAIIKRRIGAENSEFVPERITIRISPSHIYALAVRVTDELKILRNALN